MDLPARPCHHPLNVIYWRFCQWGHCNHRLTRNPLTGREVYNPGYALESPTKPWKPRMPSHGCQAPDLPVGWAKLQGGGPERHILNLYPGNDYTWTSLKIAPQVILTHSPPLRIRTPVLGILNWISYPLPSSPSKPSRAQGHPSGLPRGSTRG